MPAVMRREKLVWVLRSGQGESWLFFLCYFALLFLSLLGYLLHVEYGDYYYYCYSY